MTSIERIQDVSPSVIGSVLFGSEARGDADEFSDRDICTFFEDIRICERVSVREQLATIYSTKASSVCMYSRATSESMAKKGSLFLWHLKLESRILYDPERFVIGLFESVAPYTGYREDISRYSQIAFAVQETLAERGKLNNADLHALFVALRNTCLLLTIREGSPVFARKLTLEAAYELFPELPNIRQLYDVFSAYHLIYTRNARLPVEAIDPCTQLEYVRSAIDFIKRARVLLEI